MEGVTIDNLLTVEPHGRNECLMGALKRIGLAEKTGRGVDRIFEGSLYCGRPLPDYSASTSANVKVFIARSAPDKLFMRMINEEYERTGRPLSQVAPCPECPQAAEKAYARRSMLPNPRDRFRNAFNR